MSSVAQNTFAITGSAQFSEFGFSRIPMKGCHHHHLQMQVEGTPSTNTALQRTYNMAGLLDLRQLGPQQLMAFKIHATDEFWDDLSIGGQLTTTKTESHIQLLPELIFSTSLGTELSALDKSVTPSAQDYTASQYRLVSYVGSRTQLLFHDAVETDQTGTGGAGLSGQFPSFSDFKWFDKWIDFRTMPLVVGPHLVTLLNVNVGIDQVSATGAVLDTGAATAWNLEMDLITCNVQMTAEDIWFSRRLFNQEATNRLVYYRFAKTT